MPDRVLAAGRPGIRSARAGDSRRRGFRRYDVERRLGASGGAVLERGASRAAAVEMGGVVQAAAEDAKVREELAAERDRRLTRLTK